MERKVIGVKFKKSGKLYYFACEEFDVKSDTPVIVETRRGLEYGMTVTDVVSQDEKNLFLPLKKVIKVATDRDREKYQKNIQDAKDALLTAEKLVQEFQLKMQMFDCEYTFDRKQLIFYFVAEDRVDFRELVRKIASIFKTRIELRQVGVRDEAKIVGGIGTCGRVLCCNSFLDDFASVSINMAKNQNLSLNPSKISGSCGRLLCCLVYEDEEYKKLRKGLPDYGKKYKTEFGVGKVIFIDLLKRIIKVDVPKHGIVELYIEEVSK